MPTVVESPGLLKVYSSRRNLLSLLGACAVGIAFSALVVFFADQEGNIPMLLLGWFLALSCIAALVYAALLFFNPNPVLTVDRLGMADGQITLVSFGRIRWLQIKRLFCYSAGSGVGILGIAPRDESALLGRFGWLGGFNKAVFASMGVPPSYGVSDQGLPMGADKLLKLISERFGEEIRKNNIEVDLAPVGGPLG